MADARRIVRRSVPAACLAATLLCTVAIGGGLIAQDHRQSEADQKRVPAATVEQKLTDPVLQGAVDLHAHSDPDSYRRSIDGIDAAKMAKARGMRGLVLKNHFTQTAGLAYLARKEVPGIEVFGGIALNTPVGGINPEAVRHMVEVRGGYGKVVWMPTHDSEQEIRELKEKRPAVPVSRNGKLLPAVLEVLDLIARHDLVLATGHVTPEEAFLLIEAARARKIARILVTHPRLGREFTYLSVAQMQEAAKRGALLEIVAFFAVNTDDARIRDTADVIRAVGPASIVVSSDMGLAGLPLHTDALAIAGRALRAQGFSERDLNLMFKENPARLLGLK